MSRESNGWVATYGATFSPSVPTLPGPASRRSLGNHGFSDQTIRLLLPLSLGGSAVRVRLSNRLGTNPSTFDSVTVGRSTGADGVDGTLRVTFGGRDDVTLSAGGDALSDPVELRTDDLDRLVVSLYAKGPSGPVSQTDVDPLDPEPYAFLAAGNHTRDESHDEFEPVIFQGIVASVDVLAPDALGTVAVLGDSTSLGYPRFLAERAVSHRLGVLNVAMAGNRLLTSSPCFGAAGLTRFPDDVLLQSGARSAVAMWINDIGLARFDKAEMADEMAAIYPEECFPRTDVSAEGLISGWKQLYARARAAGVILMPGTTTPFKGAFYRTEEKDEVRLKVNDWLRHSGEFETIVDYDAALQDPADPMQMDPGFHVGDFLHPSPEGSRAMAEAVDLTRL